MGAVKSVFSREVGLALAVGRALVALFDVMNLGGAFLPVIMLFADAIPASAVVQVRASVQAGYGHRSG